MEQRISPRQGEIWDVDFDPIRGHEQGGRRPALVVSHDRFNRNISALCLVVPLTTRLRGTTVEVPFGAAHEPDQECLSGTLSPKARRSRDSYVGVGAHGGEKVLDYLIQNPVASSVASAA